MANKYFEEASAWKEELIGWRRILHQIPEVDIHLPQTVKFVTDKLTEMGIEYTVYEENSTVVATFGKGEKCLMLRGDMDALPGQELSGLDFASTNGCFHGCGHDLHCTTMLGVCKMLKAHEEELTGVIKVVFQSGEETFAGAPEAIKDGVLHDPEVNAAFAMHVFAGYELGKVIYHRLFLAACYGFRLRVYGVGGHGSQPERCCDPINACVQIYQAMQTLIARECPPKSPATLTFGMFRGGQAANAIPAECVMEGTLRCFERETRELLIRRINEIAKDVAKAYKCTCEIDVLSNVPCTESDAKMLDDCLKSMEGIATGYGTEQFMGSEDFPFYVEEVPECCYLVMGAGVEDPALRCGQHNPKILFNEDVFPYTVAGYMQVAMDWLAKNA